jgi:NitT/TauT family transport system permease protein
MAADLQAVARRSDTEAELSGLDALELAVATGPARLSRVWGLVWPKLVAVLISLALWQAVAMSGWKEDYALPGPWPVLQDLAAQVQTATFWQALAVTMRRALLGFAVATLIGLLIGVVVARFRSLRSAVGALITGLQTMPSIAWFPLAILLFGLTEKAIFFVVVLGAAPSVANGVINGVDYVPPLLVRAGRNLGATGVQLYRHVVLPAALPSIIGGLKQGWAFAWRSLMAGELLVILAYRPSVGVRLSQFRELADAQGLIATMIVILVIGIAVDAVFNVANDAVRRRWGVDEALS